MLRLTKSTLNQLLKTKYQCNRMWLSISSIDYQYPDIQSIKTMQHVPFRSEREKNRVTSHETKDVPSHTNPIQKPYILLQFTVY